MSGVYSKGYRYSFGHDSAHFHTIVVLHVHGFSFLSICAQLEALEDVYRRCLLEHPDDFDEEQSFFLLGGITDVNKLQVRVPHTLLAVDE